MGGDPFPHKINDYKSDFHHIVILTIPIYNQTFSITYTYNIFNKPSQIQYKPYKKINIDPYIKVVSHFYGHIEIDKRAF